MNYKKCYRCKRKFNIKRSGASYLIVKARNPRGRRLSRIFLCDICQYDERKIMGKILHTG